MVTSNDKVVYVEPNLVYDFTAYNSVNAGEVYKSVSNEDMCIIVGLEVEIKSRSSVLGQGDENNIIQLNWQSGANGEKASFTEGTKIYTTPERKEYIKALTTNYTDPNLFGIHEVGSAELFGIKSIDISYKTFMIPEVTIQFVDVRGVSLFAQEEMRHNMINKGISGSINKDVEGSFFKSFFTFPYPKYTLKVKGFYGEMVSYELTCSDFKAAFDSNTGNFNVTATFIGYAFSFLTDIMVNYITVAPYCEYFGRSYWEENVSNKRFRLEGKNGADDIGMITLIDLCKAYKEIKEGADKILEELGPAKILQQNGGTEEEIKSVSGETEEYETICAYHNLMASLQEIYTKINDEKDSSCGNIAIRPENTNSYAFIIDNDDDDEKYNSIKDKLEELTDSFKKFNVDVSTKIKKYNVPHDKSFLIGHYEDYTEIVADRYNATNKYILKESYISENVLREAIEKKSEESIKGKDYTYFSAWVDGWNDASDIYFYQDWGLKDILPQCNNSNTPDELVGKEAVEKATNMALQMAAEKILKFPPTVENITKIIMAHVETFIKMVSQCIRNINSPESPRTTSSLNIDASSLSDINTTLGTDENTYIPPFPQFKVWRNENGVKKEEEEWPGNINGITSDNFEEIKLVDGILNGVERVVDEMNISGVNELVNGGEKHYEIPIQHPLTYYDLFLNPGETPFGKLGEVNIDDINEIFARFCVRAFGVFATQNNTELTPFCYGCADAENFIDYFGIDNLYNSIGDVINPVTVADIMKFLQDGDKKLDQSKTGTVWGNYIRNLIECPDNYNSTLKLCIGNWGSEIGTTFKEHQIFPVIDWSFKDFSYVNSSGPTTKNFTNCIVTPCLSNDDDVVSVCVKLKEGEISKFKRLYDNSMSSSIGEANKIVEKIFKKENGFEFGENGVSKWDIWNSDCLLDKEGEIKSIDELSYDNDGNVENFSEYSINFRNNFLNLSVPNDNIIKRAEVFLQVVFPIVSSNQHLYKEIVLNIDKATFTYATKFELLILGMAFFEGYPAYQNVRPEIKNFFKNYFIEWVNGEYKTLIDANYSLHLKDNYTIDSLYKELKDNLSNEIAVNNIILNHLEDGDVARFKELYEVKIVSSGNFNTGKHVFLATRPNTKPMNNLMKSLNQIVAVSTVSKYNKNKEEFEKIKTYQTTVFRTHLEGYFDGVLQTLKDKINKKQEEITNQSTNERISFNDDEADVKHGVYMYLKLLHDRWLASGDQEKLFDFEGMFYGENPTFHFIDSVYNKIGKTTYLDLSSLVSDIVQSQSNSQYPLFSMLSNIYAKNKMMIIAINNFIDLSRPDAMQNMFKPLSYTECHEPKNHMNFIVVLPYEPSTKLAVNGADFEDTGFYLNKEEYTWPKMIQEKNTGVGGDLSIPAFGVSYGQQYQNYFKEIQVDTSAPIATEQSIAAKFMIAGSYRVAGENDKSIITYGQDLYTIRSNNSYTCTVTMMGCAWVQPMMYFVLTNIPMFGGSYQIIRVTHQIRPGFMTTTFKGVRMSKVVTRSVKNYVFGGSLDSIGVNGGSGVGGNVPYSSQYANISNDCPYAYYNPIISNSAKVTENDKKAYCIYVYNALVRARLTPEQAMGICANIKHESRFEPYLVILDENKSKTSHGFSGGLCMFHKGGEANNLFNFVYGNSGMDILNQFQNKLEPIWDKNPHNSNESVIREMGIRFPISIEDQMRYIISMVSGPYSGITKCNTAEDATNYWMDKFEKPGPRDWNRWKNYKVWVQDAIASNIKLSSIEDVSSDSGVTVDSIASGLTMSFTRSLQTSQDYSNTTVSMKKVSDGKYEYTASGTGANNALFDCALSTYSGWFDEIEWYVGNTNINNDALSVRIHITKDLPANKQEPKIKIVGDDGGNVLLLCCKDVNDINDSLKLSLQKLFNKDINEEKAKNNIAFEAYAKYICPSLSTIGIGELSDEFKTDEISREDDKNKTKNKIISCDSVMGFGSITGSSDDDGKGEIRFNDINSEYKPNSDNYDLTAANRYLINHSYEQGEKSGDCAKYVRKAIDVGFNTDPDKNSYTGKTGKRPVPAWRYVYFLPQIGFKFIGTTDNTLKGGYKPKFGDIAVYQKNYNDKEDGHICIYSDYNGGKWVSDFRQTNLIVHPNKLETAYIFRYGGQIINPIT